MPNRCCYIGCPNRPSGRKFKTMKRFHRFPKDVERCQEWIERCGREDMRSLPIKTIVSTFQLCEDHFDSEQFICPTADQRKLIWNALPKHHNDTLSANKPPEKRPKTSEDHNNITILNVHSTWNRPEGNSFAHIPPAYALNITPVTPQSAMDFDNEDITDDYSSCTLVNNSGTTFTAAPVANRSKTGGDFFPVKVGNWGDQLGVPAPVVCEKGCQTSAQSSVIPNNQNKPPVDEYDSFGRKVAESLRITDPCHSEEVMRKIRKILMFYSQQKCPNPKAHKS